MWKSFFFIFSFLQSLSCRGNNKTVIFDFTILYMRIYIDTLCDSNHVEHVCKCIYIYIKSPGIYICDTNVHS